MKGFILAHNTFEPGELALPIGRIIWAPDNDAHWNHLHVEGPHVEGTLDDCTSKWTEAITTIRGALDGKFGEGDHYQVWDDTLAWTHMGVFNCRNIAGTNTPSQHAFSNAIDIGPYYGQAQQQKFYDFLTLPKEDNSMAFNDHEEAELKRIIAALDEVDSNGAFAKYTVLHLRDHPAVGEDTVARNTANAALNLAKQIRAKLKNLY